MNKVAAIKKLNDTELELGIAGTGASWHQKYLQCDAVYVGGLPDTFTEHDLLGVLEQYGTILHVHLVRDSNTNTSRGFAFVRYADPRSCILAVDNLNGFEVKGRSLRLDHADDYRDKDNAGMDTTPPGFYTQEESPSTRRTDPNSDKSKAAEESAEKRRESAVLNRLEQLRKRRRVRTDDKPNENATEGHEGPSQPKWGLREGTLTTDKRSQESSDKKEKRLEKEKRRREKDRRKEERARIRKERAERRATRQNAT